MDLKLLEKKGITREEFIEICNNSKTMTIAAVKLGLHRATFEKYAKYLGCYKPNQGNHLKEFETIKRKSISLEDIIYKGLHPQYNRCNLKNRLVKEGLKEWKCECCGLREWNGKQIPIELEHIDGNTFNHLFENLRFLCPNCHAQTDTYRGKNVANKYPQSKDEKKEKVRIRSRQGKDRKVKGRSLEMYFDDRREQQKLINQEKISLINSSNINFTQRGWRLELAKLFNSTAQHAGEFLKKHLPEIWKEAWKHIK